VQNSKVITGQSFYAGYRIKIQGTRLGKPYSMTYKYRLDSPTQITLLVYSIGDFPDDSFDVKWEGDTGTVSWIIEGSAGRPAEVGTGTGSDTVIRFSPGTFSAPGAPTGPGTRPDEILLHEMVHGTRQMKGRAVFEQVTGNPGMDNYEEFAAIVISNVYRSEMKLLQLRKDHAGFAPLTGPDVDAATFKTTYEHYLSSMLIEQRTERVQSIRLMNRRGPSWSGGETPPLQKAGLFYRSGSSSSTKLPCVLSLVAGSGPRPAAKAASSIRRA
jgi:hypothetical protein